MKIGRTLERREEELNYLLMNEIINIKVVQKSIDNEKKRFVNARELHKWLKVGRQFADWIKDRIEKYDFVEGTDFLK